MMVTKLEKRPCVKMEDTRVLVTHTCLTPCKGRGGGEGSAMGASAPSPRAAARSPELARHDGAVPGGHALVVDGQLLRGGEGASVHDEGLRLQLRVGDTRSKCAATSSRPPPPPTPPLPRGALTSVLKCFSAEKASVATGMPLRQGCVASAVDREAWAWEAWAWESWVGLSG
jgi:hypothetical protein